MCVRSFFDLFSLFQTSTLERVDPTDGGAPYYLWYPLALIKVKNIDTIALSPFLTPGLDFWLNEGRAYYLKLNDFKGPEPKAFFLSPKGHPAGPCTASFD